MTSEEYMARIAFLYVTLLALLPLFSAMPVEIGGVGFNPSMIEYILSNCSTSTAVVLQ
jgi:hypothetical protein